MHTYQKIYLSSVYDFMYKFHMCVCVCIGGDIIVTGYKRCSHPSIVWTCIDLQGSWRGLPMQLVGNVFVVKWNQSLTDTTPFVSPGRTLFPRPMKMEIHHLALLSNIDYAPLTRQVSHDHHYLLRVAPHS